MYTVDRADVCAELEGVSVVTGLVSARPISKSRALVMKESPSDWFIGHGENSMGVIVPLPAKEWLVGLNS